LAKEPAARYRNASQLAHILQSQLTLQQPYRQPEPSTADRAPEPEHLMVPPPPASSPAPTWSSHRIEVWSDEPASVDRLMIVLLIAALIAVLGLIPLWRTVYRRYAGPEPASAPASSFQPENDILSTQLGIERLECQTKQHLKLDEVGFVWYHSGLLALNQTRHAETQELSGFGSPAYGSGQQSVVNYTCNL
jgi:hypothetical protein